MGSPASGRARVILIDTSVLIGALAGTATLEPALASVIARGEQLGLCAPVLYEWRRGPRTELELTTQEELLPADSAWPFGPAEALIAADLYRRVRRARQRELDLAIAACALARGAALWTLNPNDFSDVPDLILFEPNASH
jgi:predicted nucleic acid-binding protein